MAKYLSFITNEEENTVLNRFVQLVRNSRDFDCLVGFFYLSGFHLVCNALETADKIRILIGIGTDLDTYESIKKANKSHKQTKRIVSDAVKRDLAESEDKKEIEESVSKFIEWKKSGKLEIKACPSRNVHAKMYIFTFKEDGIDLGRVITGSSNFTKSGLEKNFEVNVELREPADYEFAKEKFKELWDKSVDVTEEFVKSAEGSWIKAIKPYELYLKFLYEYFQEELGDSDDVGSGDYPDGFMKLEYQKDAVIAAKRIIEKYGGVFLCDVVGLGKTYMATMLAKDLSGKTIVIAPPVLLEEGNPGSWSNVFYFFDKTAKFCSTGKLDSILEKLGYENYDNVIIDEAHRFRNESNITYETMARICRGKRLILVSATPFNNKPTDLLNQIKLFQNPKESNIGILNLERFFQKLESKLKGLDRQKDKDEYFKIIRKNAAEIRDKVLRNIMIRRTRTDIESVYGDDLKEQGIKFPDVENPVALYYEFSDDENRIFDETISMITGPFKYSRYTPLLHLKRGLQPLEKQSQVNLGGFMKILLVKRLESSFHAFRMTIERFIQSYRLFIRELERGRVLTSKDYSGKLFNLLANDDFEKIEEMIEQGKAEEYKAKDFKDSLKNTLVSDLEILLQIKEMWGRVLRDPKLLKLMSELKKNKRLKNKVVLFTESRETAEYLSENIKEIESKTLCFSGSSSAFVREDVIDNFDAKAKNPKDDYRILISTEVLSEGVNLHRSNTVINYDIPWNPTRMMQRVGRVNRIDTEFDEIHTFNFFPTVQSNNIIKLKEAAEAKIEAFLTLLGDDALLLTEGEPIGSHELFEKLNSKETIVGAEESEISELKYFKIIKDVRDNDEDLFERIKKLPLKTRSAKLSDLSPNHLISYFRKGHVDRFYKVAREKQPEDITFLDTAALLDTASEVKSTALPQDYFDLLDKNKKAFEIATSEGYFEPVSRSRDSARDVVMAIRHALENPKQLTEAQEEYLKLVESRIDNLPKHTISEIRKTLKELGPEAEDSRKIYAVLKRSIPETLLYPHYTERKAQEEAEREIILSMFLKGEK